MAVRFESIPVLDVNINNLHHLWPSLMKAVESATFIAIDTELSGIGTRKTLMAKSVEDRYKGTADNAKSRSVVSLGLSCFQLTHVDTKPRKHTSDMSDDSSVDDGSESCHVWNFLVQTYNIMALCQEEYIVEPASLRFLVEHGFDFNKQYSCGVGYYRGNDKVESPSDNISLRSLFTNIVRSSKPVVFHNALTDLVYLYQNFYANLPATMSSFIADLTEIFPGGVYDTKYITDYVHRMPASYLEYVFRKSQRDNLQRYESDQSSVTINILPYPHSETVNQCRCGLPQKTLQDTDPDPDTFQAIKDHICQGFAGHGWCGNGNRCTRSHDIDLILDLDQLVQTKKSRKRKRRIHNQQQENGDNSDEKMGSVGNQFTKDQFEEFIVSRHENREICKAGCHRAGFDSFMTGFSFAVYISKYGNYNDSFCLDNCGMEAFKNNVYLSGKDMPLSIVKSAFSKTSKDHKEKIKRISENGDNS
ncbi:target of EGR1 protein 1-like [Saccostrea echinata]|uniref:target of EGR1 protein 1-like n=1 Tax=Saccostrea echinata TaxID=191078 RepID=UPI002A7EFF46|nr:target of EGR1 protein 1-like [Saccostrea echinata]